MKWLWATVLVLAAAPACTSKNWYEGMREGARHQCRQTPDTGAAQACVERVNRQTYEQYEKDRPQ